MAEVWPYVKQTWTDDVSSASAARMTVLEEGNKANSQPPAVRVTHSAAQSITNATNTALAFNTERFDQAGGVASTMHDTVTNNSRLTTVYAGVYLIAGSVEFAANATGARYLFIRHAGTDTLVSQTSLVNSGSLTTQMVVTTLHALAAATYVELMVYQNSGGALNVNVTAFHSPEFMMVRVA